MRSICFSVLSISLNSFLFPYILLRILFYILLSPLLQSPYPSIRSFAFFFFFFYFSHYLVIFLLSSSFCSYCFITKHFRLVFSLLFPFLLNESHYFVRIDQQLKFLVIIILGSFNVILTHSKRRHFYTIHRQQTHERPTTMEVVSSVQLCLWHYVGLCGCVLEAAGFYFNLAINSFGHFTNHFCLFFAFYSFQLFILEVLSAHPL